MSERINKMFSVIADNYDKANTILSMGRDNFWRTYAAQECVSQGKKVKVLDVATGTGELAFAIIREAELRNRKASVIGADFNKDMLVLARKKMSIKKIRGVKFIEGDALDIKSGKGSFDVVTSGFALRNFDNLRKFIDEAYRVLKPNGKLVLLDMAKPEAGPLNSVMQFYYFNIIPLIGAHYYKSAYVHLVNTVWDFNKEELTRMVKATGFKSVKIKNLTLGAAFVLTAKKVK